MDRSAPRMIYESPDGGKTVYAREAGTTREWDAEAWESQARQREDWELFTIIYYASLTNSALRDILDQAKALYLLSRQDG